MQTFSTNISSNPDQKRGVGRVHPLLAILTAGLFLALCHNCVVVGYRS